MNDELDFLLERPAAPRDTFRWATVTGTSPLRIRFDGDTAPTAATPTSIAGPVGVGDRVWVQHHARSIIILGRRDRGQQPYAVATGEIIIPVAGGWHPVSFPAGRFTKAPIVTATVQDDKGDAQGVIVRIASGGLVGVTTSGFNMHLVDATGTVAEEARISWIAVQMKP